MNIELPLEHSECQTCYGTGRILEVWNATKTNQYGNQGSAYNCPEGCKRSPTFDGPRERVIHHKDKK